MKEGWVLKTLLDISENLDSKRIPITKGKRQLGEVPYFGASGIVDHVDDHLFDEDLLLISEDGANLLARTYPIAFSISGKSWVNNHAHVLRFECQDTQRFVEYYFNSIGLDEYVSGMAQPKLNQKSLNRIKIPIPPLPEQKRIVAILDQAFAAIDQAKANIEQNIKNAQELFQSKLNGVFSLFNPEAFKTTVGEQLTLQRGYDITKREQIKGKIPVVSSGGIKSFHNKAMVNAPGVVIGRKGTLGKVFFLNEPFWPHDTTLWIKDFYSNTPEIVYYFFRWLNVQHLNSGSANPALNRNQVHPLEVFWPKTEDQSRTLYYLKKLESESGHLSSVYNKKLEYLENLKKSILQKAFAGELSEPVILND